MNRIQMIKMELEACARVNTIGLEKNTTHTTRTPYQKFVVTLKLKWMQWRKKNKKKKKKE